MLIDDPSLPSRRRRLGLAMAAALLVLPRPAAGQPATDTWHPRLSVVLVVDQMRRDYVDRFAASWTGGLSRLVNRGAVFSRAAYPYVSTWTCAGHATIGTGAYPAVHGIVENSWFDRRTAQVVRCAADREVSAVGYRVTPGTGSSAARLRVPTFAESLRVQRAGARTAVFSLKDRSAVMLAGHRADVVTWFDNRASGWTSSTQYTAHPLPFLADFIAAHPVASAVGSVWRRRLDPSAYRTPDDGVGEDPPRGWTRQFPHRLGGAGRRADRSFYEHWRESPDSDAYLERLAEATVAGLSLGDGSAPDFLAISFSALDNVGHDFGPASQEVQDVLAHLDDTIGRLLAFLDERLGPDAYVVALTSDHGVQAIPEQAVRQGLDAGRVSAPDASRAVEAALVPILGRGPHVARIVNADLYFDPAQAAAILANPAAVSAARRALLSQPGIARVITARELASPAGSGASPRDEVLDAARLTYVPDRSGDLLIIPRPGWIITGRPPATNHGTGSADDRDVPLILMGAGIRPGRYTADASPADIAPTLATLVGITLDRAQGRVLSEAIDR